MDLLPPRLEALLRTNLAIALNDNRQKAEAIAAATKPIATHAKGFEPSPIPEQPKSPHRSRAAATKLPSLLRGRSHDRRPISDRDSPGRTNGNAVSNPRIRA